jgi:hypothetical protein
VRYLHQAKGEKSLVQLTLWFNSARRDGDPGMALRSDAASRPAPGRARQ